MNNSFVGWLPDPQNLTKGDLLYDPVSNSWIPVPSLAVLAGTTYVYDVQTSVANNYIANRILVDMKMP
jgi:intein/homing endonuclease